MSLLDDLKINEENPRTVTKKNFERLKKQIKKDPDFLAHRPIIFDENNNVIAGNQRLRALRILVQEEGFELKDEYFGRANGWSQEKKERFMIEDNAHAGEWDWDELANKYDIEQLNEWGVDLPAYNPELNPDSNALDVTQRDIEKAESDQEFNAKTPERSVICPNCHHEFYLDK